MPKAMDLIGQRFGRLVVIKRVENSRHGKTQWLCLCDCGNEVIVIGAGLKNGTTRSCGCFNIERIIERNTKHGHKTRKGSSPTYQSWRDMMQRCYNPKNKEYHNYGGRGIRVCDRWHDFENFLEDMGERSEELEIERIDNNGHYCLENCKWDTRENQANNTRVNVFLEYNGARHTRAEWSRILGVSYDMLKRRQYAGWTDEEILTTPVGEKRGAVWQELVQ